MEYLQLGNLNDQHEVSKIDEKDMVECMHQCLKAIDFLHCHKMTHRDIKPLNILVSARSPLTIKLADFGLAQDRSTLKTICGNWEYSPPESFLGKQYSNAVDIWPVAVILFEFVYDGFSQIKQQKASRKYPANTRAWALDWCRRLIEAADDLESDILIDFLTKYMLKWDPYKRLSAADCLSKGLEIGLFNGTFSNTGNITPRSQVQQGADNTSVENASTLLMGSLWRGVSGDLSRQEECSAQLGHPSKVTPDLDELKSCHASMEGSGNEGGISFDSQEAHKRTVKRRRALSPYNSSQLGDIVGQE